MICENARRSKADNCRNKSLPLSSPLAILSWNDKTFLCHLRKARKPLHPVFTFSFRKIKPEWFGHPKSIRGGQVKWKTKFCTHALFHLVLHLYEVAKHQQILTFHFVLRQRMLNPLRCVIMYAENALIDETLLFSCAEKYSEDKKLNGLTL